VVFVAAGLHDDWDLLTQGELFWPVHHPDIAKQAVLLVQLAQSRTGWISPQQPPLEGQPVGDWIDAVL